MPIWRACADAGLNPREKMVMIKKTQVSGLILGTLLSCAVLADDHDESIHSDAANFNYVGDDVHIGIGYDSDTDLTGEFFWSFSEESDSAWIAEGWFGKESAGGLKLNYHWLTGGVEAGTDAEGNTIYSDGRVNKFFVAGDRNIFDDGKVTAGFGSERNNKFWAIYASRATTGERVLGQQRTLQDMLVTGVVDNHAFSRTDTLETITDLFAHPYDRGVGVRVGKYFDNSLVRVRAGLDYESGDYDTSQTTAYLGLDKRFQDSAHGISLRAEVLRKDGEFEIDDNDTRFSAFWTWDFGTTFRPSQVYREVEVERIPDASELPREQVVEVVSNQVTLDNTASFELDSHVLNDPAKAALRSVLSSLSGIRVAGNISVIGHTCSLGTDEYNQGLSERRARSVFDFLVANGVDADMLQSDGRGEIEPRYSNETEESRKRNRRVEIAFTAEEEVMREVIVGEGQPITEWIQEKVPVEAAWIRRALRNPIAHKRSVDFYRYNRVTENLTTGETIIENTGPSAVNDAYTLEQDSGDNSLNILSNDSDPEGDELSIVSVTSPAYGTAVISGSMIIYTPDSGYYGPDSFSYTVEDGYGGSASADVNIVVQRLNEGPQAQDDQFIVVEDTSGNMLDVLSNDSDPDGDDFSIILVTTPLHGTASINGDMISYTPNPGYVGSDSFSYTIKDSFDAEATAQVSITVEAANQAPVAVDDAATTLKNTPVIIDLLANDSDPDGDPITIIEIIQAENKMGFVVNNGDGTVTYTPMAGWWGGDSFQYRISDGKGETAMATVSLNVREPIIISYPGRPGQ